MNKKTFDSSSSELRCFSNHINELLGMDLSVLQECEAVRDRSQAIWQDPRLVRLERYRIGVRRLEPASNLAVPASGD